MEVWKLKKHTYTDWIPFLDFNHFEKHEYSHFCQSAHRRQPSL